jgi:hypothetical protein
MGDYVLGLDFARNILKSADIAGAAKVKGQKVDGVVDYKDLGAYRQQLLNEGKGDSFEFKALDFLQDNLRSVQSYNAGEFNYNKDLPKLASNYTSLDSTANNGTEQWTETTENPFITKEDFTSSTYNKIDK